jgi:hypothetical protein
MARGTTLQELVTMVREEAGHSTNAGLGQNTLDGLKQKIRRQQVVLWQEHEWPHLRVERDIVLQAGQRYYAPPTDLSLNHRIDLVHVFHDGRWQTVDPGITLDQYNYLDSDADVRQDPVLRWELYEAEQIEVWPIPKTNGIKLRLQGTRNLRALVADGDTADLDDRLITLFVAAELLAKQKSDDAGPKLSMAQRLLTKLKGNNSKIRTFMVGDRGAHRNNGCAQPMVGRYPMYGPKQ